MKNLKLFLLDSKLQRLMLIVLVLLLLSMVVSQCKNEETSLSAFNNLQQENELYKLKNEQLVNSSRVVEIYKNQLKEVVKTDSLLKELSKEFSKLKAIQSFKIKTKVEKIETAFNEPIAIKDVDTITGELKFNRSGAVFNKWYEFGYTVTQDSLIVEPFATWTDVKRVDGLKRKWFLGKQTYTSDIILTNPFMQTSEIKTYEVVVSKKWYDSRLFNVAVGFGLSEIIRRR